MMILLILSFITAQLQCDTIDETIIYSNVGNEWDAEAGDTLVFTTKIPMSTKEEYRLRMTGDARGLQVWYKLSYKFPLNEWTDGFTTGGNYHIIKWWNPWQFYELQIALVALVGGERELNVFFEKWEF
jgi:hypothetical protein